jgi:hypothetical protein
VIALLVLKNCCWRLFERQKREFFKALEHAPAYIFLPLSAPWHNHKDTNNSWEILPTTTQCCAFLETPKRKPDLQEYIALQLIMLSTTTTTNGVHQLVK